MTEERRRIEPVETAEDNWCGRCGTSHGGLAPEGCPDPYEDEERFIEAVKAHALKHYSEDGWDYVVECWEDEDISERIVGAQTAEKAIEMVAHVAKLLDDRRADVRGFVDEPDDDEEIVAEAIGRHERAQIDEPERFSDTDVWGPLPSGYRGAE